MRHLIERVLELSDDEQTKPLADIPPIGTGDEAELKALLESLQPRIRVYGVGGAGCNAINRLFEENLFDSDYVTGYAINTDAQALLMSPIENKVLIGRTARGRGAGGDPTKGEAAALESEISLRKRYSTCYYHGRNGWWLWNWSSRTYRSIGKKARGDDNCSSNLSIQVRGLS